MNGHNKKSVNTFILQYIKLNDKDASNESKHGLQGGIYGVDKEYGKILIFSSFSGLVNFFQDSHIHFVHLLLS
jgi:hypothetical protein